MSDSKIIDVNLTVDCFYCNCDVLTCSKDSIINPCRKFLILTLKLTDRCNESCRHCYCKDGFSRVDRDMTVDDVSALFDYADREFGDYNIVLSFLGGEPTLKLDVIDFAMAELMRRRGRNFGRIYTNGLGNVKELVALLMKHRNIKIQVALPHHSSKHYNERLANLRYYIKMQNNRGVEFSLVAERNDIGDLYEIVRFWKAQGVRNLYINFDIRDVDVSPREVFAKEIYRFYDHATWNLVDANFKILNLNTLGERFEEVPVEKPDTYIIDYFPDRRFYPVHHVETPPVGDTTNGVNLSVLTDIYTRIPCRSCVNSAICGTAFKPVLVRRGGYMKPYPAYCIPIMVTSAFNNGIPLEVLNLDFFDNVEKVQIRF